MFSNDIINVIGLKAANADDNTFARNQEHDRHLELQIIMFWLGLINILV